MKLIDILLVKQFENNSLNSGSGSGLEIGGDENVLSSGMKGAKSLGVPVEALVKDRGVIIDSGTTDTYLPKGVLADTFISLFKSISGVKYTEDKVSISLKQLALLPNIAFIFEGK